MISNWHSLQKFSLISLLILISLTWKNEIIAGELALSWTDSSNNENGFRIDRKTGTTGTYIQIAITGANVSSYIDSGLVDGATYCYRVSAFNASGVSPYTNEGCATVSSPLPPSPSPNPQTFALSVTKAGSGTVTSTPTGINCGSDCSEIYNSGTSVILTATPATGSTFAGWSGDPDCLDGSVTVNASKTCTATFNLTPQTFTLAVNLVKTMTTGGTGSGTVTSTPAGINCGTDCSEGYASGTSVKLTTTPAAGSIFAGWSGDPDCSDGSVTMNASKSCTATFSLASQTFALSVTRAGSGTVTSTPAGVNCGTDCSESYSSGTVVTLTAIPAEGSNFLGWSGGVCSGTGTCNVTVTANISVAANFSQAITTQRIGLFRPATGEWYLDLNGNGIWDGCEIDRCIHHFGQATDRPLVADWIGSGIDITGIFRPSEVKRTSKSRKTTTVNGIWYLDANNNGNLDSCDMDRCLGPYGQDGDLPVVGDWTGTGKAQIGVFRPSTGKWYLDLSGNGKLDICTRDACLGPFGQSGDLPVAGDWTGTGKARIGVFDPDTSTWHLDLNGNGVFDGCAVDACLSFGQSGDLPVVGDWTGTEITRIGVFRPSTEEWFLDINGNGKFDSCEIDTCISGFGQQGDLPVVGKW